MEEMRGASVAGSSPPFLGRERTAVDVDVCPERRSPRYHETCLVTHLDLESVEESSAAVCEPKGVWLRVPIIPSLKEACKGRKYLFFFVVMMFITVTAITVINNIFS